MNKFGVVLGVAAVVTLAGCKDPDYVRSTGTAQTEVKEAAPVEATPVAVADTKPAAPAPIVVEEAKPVVVADLSKPAPKPAVAADPEYTIYIVQRGDYLSKIAKKFNIRMDAIRKMNPKIRKGDVIWVGMKLKLPGKVDVGEQVAPAVAPAAKSSRKAYAPYTGATKEYVVKSGDSLGAIALASGISVRQLKEMNGLSKDVLRIGQKLKIPAEKVVSEKKSSKSAVKKATVKKPEAKKAEVKKPEVAAPVDEQKPVEPAPAPVADPVEPAADAAAPAEAAPAVAGAADAAVAAPAEESAPATFNYVVQEGDDIPGVAIRWGVSTAQVRELNNLTESDQLVKGQVLKLPAEAQQ